MPGTDSAGTPWEGRAFHANPFGSDDGSAPPALLEALTAFRDGSTRNDAVVDAFRHSRLLVPLIAQLGEAGRAESGHLVDKSQELSIVSVRAPDGRVALPVFSSVAAMSHWNSSARPVPSDGARVAVAAASEGTELVILDPTSTTEFVLRRPALSAIARSVPWVPSVEDPGVRAAFERAAAGEPDVAALELVEGDPGARLTGPELVLVLGVRPGLAPDALSALIERMRERWTAEGVVDERVDSLAVRIERMR
jgi:hypothetical protein